MGYGAGRVPARERNGAGSTMRGIHMASLTAILAALFGLALAAASCLPAGVAASRLAVAQYDRRRRAACKGAQLCALAVMAAIHAAS
jgi:hypothetical protein